MDEDGCGEFYPVEIECLVLIDGHNRMKICEQHGLSYRWDNILTFRSRDEAKAWIIRNQFGRRNIQPYQRAELALELEPLIAKKAKENQERSGREFGKGCQKSDEPIEPVDTKREVAKVAGLSHDTIAKAKKIRDEAPEEVKDKLRRGEISINKAYGDIRREDKRSEVKKKLDDLVARESEAPTGEYDVIVIDPPWPMEKIERDVRPNQCEFDYPTMTLDEISRMDIPSAEDCHIWLWTTQKFLPDAFDILSAWNCRYVCTFVWHKPGGFQPIGLPQYNCEFVLYGRRGSPFFLDTKAFPTCFNAPRGKHTEKPEEFYDTLRRVTAGRRLDMFNRREIDGFNGWGKEA